MSPYAEVIGTPIAHSLSPRIHAFWLGLLDLPGRYAATEVPPEALGAFLNARRGDPAWRGCNVTMPHKAAVLDLVDTCDPVAEVIGSANLVVPNGRALVAYNTDTDGIVEALGPEGLALSPVVVLGTGGAARAMLAVLATQGVREVGIIARDTERARALAARFGMTLTDPFAVGMSGGLAKLVVNATPLGQAGQPAMPESLLYYVDLLGPEATVFDMIYMPAETALLTRARAAGLRAIGGLPMLIGQAAGAFRHFFGMAAPREDKDAALLAHLAS